MNTLDGMQTDPSEGIAVKFTYNTNDSGDNEPNYKYFKFQSTSGGPWYYWYVVRDEVKIGDEVEIGDKPKEIFMVNLCNSQWKIDFKTQDCTSYRA